MKYTNAFNLPSALYKAVKNDPYTRGDANISVTGLLSPPRMSALQDTYADFLEEDVADVARILIGKATHEYIAKHADGDLDDKERLYMKVNGWVVSGQTDLVSIDKQKTAHVISDYKTVSTWEWRRGLKKEREQQLNIYAELLRTNGYEVSGLKVVLIFVDWNARQRMMNRDDYPPASIVEVDVPMWERDATQAFISERVRLHQEARKDKKLEHTFCSDSDRWVHNMWAVMKDGASRATKLFKEEEGATEEDAFAHAEKLGEGYNVEYRAGEPTRCMFYCNVGRLGFCEQWEGDK